jgi:hypothetical protein
MAELDDLYQGSYPGPQQESAKLPGFEPTPTARRKVTIRSAVIM